MKKFVIGGLLCVLVGMNSIVDAHDKGDWIFRAGIAHVAPNDDSGGVIGANGLGLVAGNDGVSVGSDTSLGLSVSYLFSDNWGIGLLGSWPFEHDITGNGAIAGLDVGSTKHLPPTLSLQYYPTTGSETFNPYIGVGINYTMFFNDKTNPALTGALNGILGGVTSTDLKLDDSTGLALQLGADWKVSDRWYINTALWFVDIDTDADVIVNGNVATTVDVEIDPWVFMAGVAVKF